MNGKLVPTSDEDLGQRDQGNSLHSEIQVPVIALSSGSTRWRNHTRNISVSKSLLMPSPSVLAGNPPCCHRRTWKMSWILLSKKKKCQWSWQNSGWKPHMVLIWAQEEGLTAPRQKKKKNVYWDLKEREHASRQILFKRITQQRQTRPGCPCWQHYGSVGWVFSQLPR